MRVASPRPAAQLTSLSLSLSLPLTPTLAAPSLSPFNGAATFAVSAAGSAATREQQLQLEAILASQLTLCAFTSTHTRTHTRLLPRTYRTLCSRIVNKNAKARINRKSGNADAIAEKCLFFARLLFAVYCLLFAVYCFCFVLPLLLRTHLSLIRFHSVRFAFGIALRLKQASNFFRFKKL